MGTRDLVCIVCPMGCKMSVTDDDKIESGFSVEGNKCSRGIVYAIKEMTNPTRVLTTTVSITEAFISRLPVKSSAPIPKEFLKQAMEIINTIKVQAPVFSGELLVRNILGTGVDIIATRSMNNI